MALNDSSIIFVGLDDIATIESESPNGWLIVERFYLPTGKRISKGEFPPESSIDAKVEEIIKRLGCDCWEHDLQGICCDAGPETVLDSDIGLINSDDIDPLDPNWDVSI